jgi:hypothetical protein
MEGVPLSEAVSVTELMPGGPAESTGNIKLWDELLAVDGHAVIGQTLEYIVNLIWYVFQWTKRVDVDYWWRLDVHSLIPHFYSSILSCRE